MQHQQQMQQREKQQQQELEKQQQQNKLRLQHQAQEEQRVKQQQELNRQQQMQQEMQRRMQQQQQLEQQQLQHQQNLQQQKMIRMQQEEKELERRNLAKIMQHRQKVQTEAENNKVFHFPQVSGFSTSEDQSKSTYSVDKNFIQNLEKDLGTSDAMANMLGPNPPPTPGMKVNIPLLQPPPQTGARQRTSPRQDGGRPLSSCGAVGVTRPTSRAGQQRRNSGSSPNQRLNSSGSSQSRLNTSGGSDQGRREETRTAHVKPFVASERSQGPAHNNQGQGQGMGDVMGAAANWRSLAGAGGRTDLLAGQRSQLGRYTDGGEANNQRSQGGGRYAEGESGSRVGGTNAMEINKV